MNTVSSPAIPASPPPPPPLPDNLLPPMPDFLRQFWIALFVFVVAADISLYGYSTGLGIGFAVFALCISLLTLWLSRCHGRLLWGAGVLVPSLAWACVAPGAANMFSIVVGVVILTWTNRAGELAWSMVSATIRSVTAPIYFVGLLGKSCVGLSRSKGVPVGKIFKIVRLLFPALLVSLFFLGVLSWGNVVLAQWMQHALDWIGALIRAIRFPEIPRMGFWILFSFLGIFTLIPALRCAEVPPPRKFLLTRRADVANVPRALVQWALVLCGVNLVFLLTNTLDVVYLWIRREPPAGVSTTEYLYGGVYGLIVATLIAGLILAGLFANGTRLTRSPWLRGLSAAWVAQNVFLIGGVAFRLWLHVESFCLTPRRVEVAFFLLLVLAGFVLLLVYIFREKSLRWLLGSNMLAVCALFFGIQFADVGGWCVNSALEKRLSNKTLKFDDNFWQTIGLPGWRLLAQLDEDARAGTHVGNAPELWRSLKKELSDAPPHAVWRSFAVFPAKESHELCAAVDKPDQDARQAWEKMLRTNYRCLRNH